ncbi:MAG: hypothetical protein M1834_001324 [Cirrosporium novae-zelandiae]|nr:MAG: hypothetical protein M1834_001324 [Cirrosporium novae-zelandiae]
MTSLDAIYVQAEQDFIAKNPKSREIYNSAVESLPGGNTRSVLFYKPYPLSIIRAEGCHLFDADGHKYTDFLGEYTAGLYGHSEPRIIQAITETVANGVNFGSQHANEGKLAKLIKDRFASIDLVRFTNSGTEAALMALAVAKIYTKRSKIMVFEGGYHGGAFVFHHGNDPINVPHEYLLATYNDTSSVDRYISQYNEDLAAIIVEPMLGSGGGIPASQQFLEHLRTKATESGAVLIFDEVMTSRLFSGGGVQSHFGIKPDMTTLGKYIGGGMSFGAFGGKREIMELFDPRSNGIRHAGTFNNNVFTMAAGRAGLEQVFTPDRAKELHAAGEELRRKLNDIGKGTTMRVLGCGSIMAFHFTKTPLEQIHSPNDFEDNPLLLDLLHLYLLDQGYYIARRGFMSLSLALKPSDLDGLAQTVGSFLREYGAMGQIV